MNSIVLTADNLKNSSQIIPLILNTLNCYDFSKTCRLCLNQFDYLISIFDKFKIDGKRLFYSEMIIECMSIQVYETDKLPKTICKECADSLINSYKFRKLCKTSEGYLHEFLNKLETWPNLHMEPQTEILENPQMEIEENPQTIESEPICLSDSDEEEKGAENSIDETVQETENEPICLSDSETESANEDLEFQAEEDPVRIDENFPIHRNETEILSNSDDADNILIVPDIMFDEVIKTEYPIEIEEHFPVIKNESTSTSVSNEDGINRLNNLPIGSKTNDEEIQPKKLDHKCKYCKAVFNQISLLGKHLTEIHNLFVCEICFQVFVHLLSLKRHMNIHKMNKKVKLKLFKCKICSKTFHRSIEYRDHLLEHPCEKSFTCTICNKTFSVYNNLCQHIKCSHNTSITIVNQFANI